jgi:hypothetical protein
VTASRQPYRYDAGECRGLRSAISEQRFATYLAAAHRNQAAALQLYTWNAAASAALYGPMQALEVTLRNAVNDPLARAYGQRWFMDPTVVRRWELTRATEVGAALGRRGAVTPGDVIAELGLGYWVGLFANAYDQTLWRTDLYRVFSPRQHRRHVHDNLDHLRTLRNRIAHHEPIFQRRLVDDYERLHQLLVAMSPTTWAWVHHHSRVSALLSTPPPQLVSF